MSLLLENANIWLKEDVTRGNLVLDSQTGKIRTLSKTIQDPANYKRINLNGCLVIPGAVDIHVHLRDFEESYKETYSTGGQAAAAGGFTTVFDMPNKIRPVDTVKRFKEVSEKASKVESVEIIPYMLLSSGTDPFLLSYPYFKAYIGPTTGNCRTGYEDISNFINSSQGLLSIHCEDEKRINENKKKYSDSVEDHSLIRDPLTETTAVSSLLDAIKKEKTETTLHLAHLSLPDTIREISGENLSFEVTPHHLFLNTDDYGKLGNFARTNPPLRSSKSQQEIKGFFIRGNIPIIATDHAPHTVEEKEQGASGVPGLETCLALLLHHFQPLDRRILNTIINAVSLNPRKLMKMPWNGEITAGIPADLTVIDRHKVKKVRGEELKTKCGWSPWEGSELKGWPVMTIKMGKITYNDL